MDGSGPPSSTPSTYGVNTPTTAAAIPGAPPAPEAPTASKPGAVPPFPPPPGMPPFPMSGPGGFQLPPPPPGFKPPPGFPPIPPPPGFIPPTTGGGPPPYPPPQHFTPRHSNSHHYQQHHNPHYHQPGGYHNRYRPGLGSSGAPGNISAANSVQYHQQQDHEYSQEQQQPPQPAEKFSLWIGSIAQGINDAWLEKILKTAGFLVSLKRVKDPSGNPKAFGFAEYGDLESVLRCLQLINGAKVRGIGTDDEKALVVRADDKLKGRLAEYEQTRDAAAKEDSVAKAKESLEQVIQEMKEPNPNLDVTTTNDAEVSKDGSTPGVTAITVSGNVRHLQDLGPDDLPESSRGVITKEIAFFRERASKIKTENDNRKKASSSQDNSKPSGYGVRVGDWGSSASRSGSGSGSNSISTDKQQQKSKDQNSSSSTGYGGRVNDAQSYTKPISFVKDEGDRLDDEEDPEAADAADDAAEARRQERKKHDANLAFQDRERRWENRERSRRNAVERERKADAASKDEQERLRARRSERLARWDDDWEAEERRKELFYIDRPRWRHQRNLEREREEAADERDRKAEETEKSAIENKTEAFLDNVLAESRRKMDATAPATDKRIVLDESTPIKLSFGAPKPKQAPGAGGEKGGDESGKKPGARYVFEEDEEDTGRKREFVPISYSDDEDDEGEGKGKGDANNEDNAQQGEDDSEQEIERRKQKVEQIVESIPQDKEGLWSYPIDWTQIDETVIKAKIEPFAVKKTVEYLGMEDDALVGAVVDHVRQQKSPADLVAELEEILEDEATDFAIKFYRYVIFESIARKEKVSTTTEI